MAIRGQSVHYLMFKTRLISIQLPHQAGMTLNLHLSLSSFLTLEIVLHLYGPHFSHL